MCCSAAPLSLPRSANHKVRKRAAKHLRIEVRSSSFSSLSSFSSILLPSCTPSVLSGSFVATVRRQILVGPTDRRSPIVSARLHGRRSLAVSRLDGVSNRRVTRRLLVLCKACHGTYSHKCTIGRGVMVDHPGPRPKGPQPLTAPLSPCHQPMVFSRARHLRREYENDGHNAPASAAPCSHPHEHLLQPLQPSPLATDREL